MEEMYPRLLTMLTVTKLPGEESMSWLTNFKPDLPVPGFRALGPPLLGYPVVSE
jgi:hypothetical protein